MSSGLALVLRQLRTGRGEAQIWHSRTSLCNDTHTHTAHTTYARHKVMMRGGLRAGHNVKRGPTQVRAESGGEDRLGAVIADHQVQAVRQGLPPEHVHLCTRAAAHHRPQSVSRQLQLRGGDGTVRRQTRRLISELVVVCFGCTTHNTTHNATHNTQHNTQVLCEKISFFYFCFLRKSKERSGGAL